MERSRNPSGRGLQAEVGAVTWAWIIIAGWGKRGLGRQTQRARKSNFLACLPPPTTLLPDPKFNNFSSSAQTNNPSNITKQLLEIIETVDALKLDMIILVH